MPLILLVIGLVLIVYNYRAIRKEEFINKENDSLNISFRSVLEDNKEELNDYKMEIGLLRRDIAESLTELQEEILEIKNNIKILKNSKKIYENKEGLEKINPSKENYIDNKVIDNNINEARGIDYLIDDIGENSLFDSTIKDEGINETDLTEKVDSNKTQNIKKLLEEGLTEEEICHELSVSKGEVLLVKGLFKK